MLNLENFELISLAIDAEFAKLFSDKQAPWLVREKAITLRAENLRGYINDYIDHKEKMQIDFVRHLNSHTQEPLKQQK